MIDEGDQEFFYLIRPELWLIESEDERMRIMHAALLATKTTRVAKVFPLRDNVWAAVQMFCSPPEVFGAVFSHAITALQYAVNVFCKEMDKEEAQNETVLRSVGGTMY